MVRGFVILVSPTEAVIIVLSGIARFFSSHNELAQLCLNLLLLFCLLCTITLAVQKLVSCARLGAA